MSTLQAIDRPAAPTAGGKYLEHAHALVPLLREEAAAIEESRQLTPRVLRELHSRNMLQVLLAPVRGEGTLDVVDLVRILKTLATGDASTAWVVMTAMGAAFLTGFLSEETAGRIFVGPADTAATAVGRIGRATATEGGYIVDAAWPFLSGSPHASWIGGLCAVFDGEQRRSGPDGAAHIVVPLLRKERVHVRDSWFVTGLRGTGSHEADVTGEFVPFDEVIDFANGPRPGLPGLYFLEEDAVAPICAAAVATGIAFGAIDAFRMTARSRPHQATGGTAAGAPLPQLSLARCEALARQAEASLLVSAGSVDRHIAAGSGPSSALVSEVSLAATMATESAIEVVSTLYRAAGSSAIVAGSVLDRALRDIYTLGAHRMVQRENYLVHGPQLFA